MGKTALSRTHLRAWASGVFTGALISRREGGRGAGDEVAKAGAGAADVVARRRSLRGLCWVEWVVMRRRCWRGAIHVVIVVGVTTSMRGARIRRTVMAHLGVDIEQGLLLLAEGCDNRLSPHEEETRAGYAGGSNLEWSGSWSGPGTAVAPLAARDIWGCCCCGVVDYAVLAPDVVTL